MTSQLFKVAHITTVDVSLHLLLLNQMLSLEDAGYKVTGISSPGDHVPVIEAAGVEHIPVPMTRSFTPLADLASLWRLYRTLRRGHFLIVHTHTPKPGLLGQIAARMAGVPIVINTLHGLYFHDEMGAHKRKFYISMEKIAAMRSDVILSQNREDIQTAVREGICAPSMIKHLGNGIDIKCFNPDRFTTEEMLNRKRELGIPLDSAVIGFVGRLAGQRKGFLDFLAAGKKLLEMEQDVFFLIVGEADKGKADAVQPAVAKQYGINERCRFLGRLPNEDVPILFTLMNALVLPSLFEGVPRVVMEASAMRVPAVVSDVKGNREAVIDGQNGVLVPLGDVNALADAIGRLLSDKELRYRMGEQGRKIAEERFDERIVFATVRDEYARLLLEKGFPVPDKVPPDRESN